MPVLDTPITTDDRGLKKVLGQKQPAVLILHDGSKNKPLDDAVKRIAKKNAGELLVIKVDVSENPNTHAKYDRPDTPAVVTMTPAFFGRNIKSTAEGVRPADVRAHVDHLLNDKPLPAEKPKASAKSGSKDKKAKHVDDKTFGKEVFKSKKPVLVDFWAAWCGPCNNIAPFIDKMADQYGNDVKVVKLNTEQSRRTAQKFGVQSLPTFIMFDEGQPIGRISGANPRAIKQLIEETIATRG